MIDSSTAVHPMVLPILLLHRHHHWQALARGFSFGKRQELRRQCGQWPQDVRDKIAKTSFFPEDFVMK